MRERSLLIRLIQVATQVGSSQFVQESARTFNESLSVMLPKPAEIGIALVVAAIGTVTYFLMPEIPNREKIPLAAIGIGAGIIIGRKALSSVNQRLRKN